MTNMGQHFSGSSEDKSSDLKLNEIDVLIEQVEDGEIDRDVVEQINELRALSTDSKVSESVLFIRKIYIATELGSRVPSSDNACQLRDECYGAVKNSLSDRSLSSSVDLYAGVAEIVSDNCEHLGFTYNQKAVTILDDLVKTVAARAVQEYKKSSDTSFADRVYVASVKAIKYPTFFELGETYDILYPALNLENKADILLCLKASLDLTEPVDDYPAIKGLSYKNMKEFLDSTEVEVRERVSSHAQAASIEGGKGTTLVLPPNPI